VQKTIEEVAKEMQPVALKMGAELDDELLKKLKDAGMQVNEVDKDAFIKASGKIYEEFSKEIPEGKELIEKSMALGKSS
jgi:TRAP-type C4-dicarboxylate transport system substrate-binding protein